MSISLCFNTSQVVYQLIRATELQAEVAFQYLIGSLSTNTYSASTNISVGFQYLIGSLSTSSSRRISSLQACFNTSQVVYQLEDEDDEPEQETVSIPHRQSINPETHRGTQARHQVSIPHRQSINPSEQRFLRPTQPILALASWTYRKTACSDTTLIIAICSRSPGSYALPMVDCTPAPLPALSYYSAFSR